jgi:hypothetical protein
MPEPHALTVRDSRIRLARVRVHRIPPNVRDDRETPLLPRRDGFEPNVIWVSEKQKYFSLGDWTGFCGRRPSGKSGVRSGASPDHGRKLRLKAKKGLVKFVRALA